MIQRLCEKLDCPHLGPCVEICSFGTIMSGNNITKLPKTKNKKCPRRCFVRGHRLAGVYPRYIKDDECVAVKCGAVKRVVGKQDGGGVGEGGERR